MNPAAQQARPFGTWPSPVTADLIVAETVRLGQIALDGEDVYWLEMRPSQGGCSAIVRWHGDGSWRDVTPPGYDVRTRVHEYGGGAFSVSGGEVFFSHDADQRVYRQRPGSSPRALTSAGTFRYADGTLDVGRRRLVCVLEDHSSGHTEPANSLAAIDLATGSVSPLTGGRDFYASPAVSPCGRQLAWLSWNHPDMPWDGAELWLGGIGEDGGIVAPRRLAGGAGESVFQPQWSPHGVLYFVSDRGGWWNLYRLEEGGQTCVWDREAEFGLPQWLFGMSTYGFESEQKLVCTLLEKGMSRLAAIDTRTLAVDFIDLPFSHIEQLRAGPGQAVFLAGSPDTAQAVVRLDLRSGEFEVLRSCANVDIDPGYLSRPVPIEFATGNGQQAHAHFYPPQNRDCRGMPGEKPPMIVKSHGGPTTAATTNLDLKTQYWTSRGFAVLDVNYGGSSGYGRAYRERLLGNWGIVDTDDCLNAARHVTARGWADRSRAVIAGGSAGGYTTLCALTFHDFFRAGASYYGVSDLEALASDTHKFESRYLERLVAPYPEGRETYVQRSPIHFTDRLSCPLIVLQGLEDKVVPPGQSLQLVEALRRKGLPVAYLAFAGEQHGFRQAATIRRALEAELYFYSRIFGFEPAGEIEPVPIDNLAWSSGPPGHRAEAPDRG